MTVIEFIEKNFDGNKSEFARANDVPRQRVNEWINAGYMVIDGWLYSPRKKKLKESLK